MKRLLLLIGVLAGVVVILNIVKQVVWGWWWKHEYEMLRYPL